MARTPSTAPSEPDTGATTTLAGSAAAANPAPQVGCVADYQELARLKLPRATYDYITAGSTDQITLRENVAAFGRLKLLPPILSGVDFDQIDLSTTVLKQPIRMPI